MQAGGLSRCPDKVAARDAQGLAQFFCCLQVGAFDAVGANPGGHFIELIVGVGGQRQALGNRGTRAAVLLRGAFLALDPDTTQRFLRAVTESAGKYTANTQKPVLMASMDIRRYVRRLIEGEHYGLPVVSYQEVTPEISIQPVSRIRL